MVTRLLTHVWLKNGQNMSQSFRKLVFELYICSQFSFLLILTAYTKFEINSLRNNEITMKLLIIDIFDSGYKGKVRNDVIFKQ